MRLSRNQLRQIISEAIQGRGAGDPEPFALDETEIPLADEDDKYSAQQAEQELDQLHSFFNENEVISKAYELVMNKLREIQGS